MRFRLSDETLDTLEAIELEDGLLLGAVLLLPWAFGGVEIWAYRSAALLLIAAAAVAFAKRGIGGLGLGDRRAHWLLPALLLAGWAALQLAPLPPAVIAAVSPEADRIYRETYPGYPGPAPPDIGAALETRALEKVPEAGTPAPSEAPILIDARGWRGWRPVSLRPAATQERMAWYFALLAGFLVARTRTRDRKRWRLYRSAILSNCVGLALFGLVQAATWNGRFYWLREAPDPSAPFGPYVNFIHFASVMEMAVPWLAGYAWMKFREPEGDTIWRSIGPVAAGAAALCFAAELAAASKASAALTVTTLTICLVAAVRGSRTRWVAGIAAVATWAGAAFLLSGTPLGDRVRHLLQVQTPATMLELDRVQVTGLGLDVVRDYPITGTGFGTFRDVFPQYLPPGESERWLQLHNDYVELLLEGGAIGALLVLWLAVGFVRQVAPAWRLQRGYRRDMDAVGLSLGVASLAVHAVVDFNHQIPGNALLFVVAAALASTAATRAPQEEAVGGPARRHHPLRWAVATVVIVVFGVRAAAGIDSGIAYPIARSYIENGEYERALPLLERAERGFLQADALWWRAHLRVGIWETRRAQGEQGQGELRAAAADYLSAAWASPASAWPWAGLAEVYDHLETAEREDRVIDLATSDGDPWRYLGRPGVVAVGLARTAIERGPGDFEYYDQLALTLLRFGLTEEALRVVEDSARVQPAFWYHGYRLLDPLPRNILVAFAAGSRDALGSAPMMSRRAHRVALGKLAWRLQDYQQAAIDFRAALDEPGDALNRAESRYWLGKALRRLGRTTEAMEELEASAEHSRFAAAALRELADLDEREGQTERALERWRIVRRLEPRNLQPCLRFAKLAGDLRNWPAAVEALEWAILIHPSEHRPRRELVQVLTKRGDMAGARKALNRWERELGRSAETRRARESLELAAKLWQK